MAWGLDLDFKELQRQRALKAEQEAQLAREKAAQEKAKRTAEMEAARKEQARLQREAREADVAAKKQLEDDKIAAITLLKNAIQELTKVISSLQNSSFSEDWGRLKQQMLSGERGVSRSQIDSESLPVEARPYSKLYMKVAKAYLAALPLWSSADFLSEIRDAVAISPVVIASVSVATAPPEDVEVSAASADPMALASAPPVGVEVSAGPPVGVEVSAGPADPMVDPDVLAEMLRAIVSVNVNKVSELLQSHPTLGSQRLETGKTILDVANNGVERQAETSLAVVIRNMIQDADAEVLRAQMPDVSRNVPTARTAVLPWDVASKPASPTPG